MVMTLIIIGYFAILSISWEIQKTDLLLGYTLGVFGILLLSAFMIDYLARKWN
jgi:hypothetical protein